MKIVIGAFSILFAIGLLFYSVFAFVEWDLNAGRWSQDGRAGLAIIVSILILVIAVGSGIYAVQKNIK